MAFWRRLFQTTSPVVDDDEQSTQPGTRSTLARNVNFDQAMSVSAWWACTRLLSELVGAMALDFYDKTALGTTKNTRHRLWRMINYQPNRYQTRNEFFELLMLNLCGNGNAYSEKQFDARGNVIQLTPMMSGQTQTHLIDGDIFHRHLLPGGAQKWFPQEKIWHVKLFGNGIVGLSPLQYAAQTLGISLATRDRATKIANSGGKYSGILMYDKQLDATQRAKIRANMRELESGSDDELFVLDKHMKYERTSLSPSDMKLMELMGASIEDICRFMGVPSVLVNHTSGTTAWGSGIKEIIAGFYKIGMRPYLERIESSMLRWLLPMREWDSHEFRFDFDSLLRTDLVSRMDSYNKGVNGGILKPNEAREMEGLPPAAGGDRLYLNGTLTPAGIVPMRPADEEG